LEPEVVVGEALPVWPVPPADGTTAVVPLAELEPPAAADPVEFLALLEPLELVVEAEKVVLIELLGAPDAVEPGEIGVLVALVALLEGLALIALFEFVDCSSLQAVNVAIATQTQPRIRVERIMLSMPLLNGA
jgi:hypothetical protein